MKLHKLIGIILIIAIYLSLLTVTVVYADNDSTGIINLNGPLEFEIKKPLKGEYSETGRASVLLKYNFPVNVSFSASELTYREGQDSIKKGTFPLAVTYYVHYAGMPENINNSFDPDSTLYINLDYEDFSKIFNVSGKIDLPSLTSQPAGKYEGTIIVTVSG